MCVPSIPVSRRSFLALAVTPACPAGFGLWEPRLVATPPGIVLTLDACMGGIDRRILDLLLARRIPATLFVTARWLRGNTETLALLRANPGQFDLQNHGARHIPAVLGTTRPYGIRPAGTKEALAAEVLGGAEAIISTGAPRPLWYRGATALYSPDALTVIAGLGFRVAGFSVNADQGATLPADAVSRRLAAAKPGDVVIAHINQPGSAAGAGVAAGIAALADGGARFVTLAAAEARGEVRPLPCA